MSTDETTATVVYQITPPDGHWDFADNGTYQIEIQPNQVFDFASKPVAPPDPVPTFTVNMPEDTAPPTATADFSTAATLAGGAQYLQFNLTYTDDVGIDATTLDSNDIQVANSAIGFSQMANFTGRNPASGNAASIMATYRISAPGGFWDSADNGTYQISLGSGAVTDTSGKPATLGGTSTFDVNVANVVLSWDGTLQVNGTSGNDKISLMTGSSKVYAILNGAKTSYNSTSVKRINIQGLAGNDWVKLNKGIIGSVINGGAGNDSIYGGAGNDNINGGDGNDLIYGYGGNDVLRGGNGNDTIYGGNGNDKIYGDAGADKLYGEVGNDVIYSRDNVRDTVDGGAGSNSCQKDAKDLCKNIKVYLK